MGQMSGLFKETDNDAELSSDGIYRYALTRQWADGQCVGWLMFNPSTADASTNDATIRKCMGFSSSGDMAGWLSLTSTLSEAPIREVYTAQERRVWGR